MNKHFFTGAFALGAAAIVWIAAGFVGTHALALAMTLLIGVAFCVGALELLRYRRGTAGLCTALAAIPVPLHTLGDWLAQLPASLQNPVRLRIEGERHALPGPAMTPYLVGLLVMLGMLGTFLGMVVTLNGAVFALEGTTDLQAIRSAFATPIKGLGLAFGTSVAGVAASAMLGLMSALSRRERLQAAQVLDTHIAGTLRPFSLAHQREQSFLALQQQAQALPTLLAHMQAMTAQMERLGQQTNQRLLENQERFHSDIQSVYTGLARSVDASLRASLSHSAQAAADGLRPVLEAALTGLATQAQQLQERQHDSTLQQLGALSSELAALRADEARRGDAAVARLGALQADVASHLARLGTALEAPIARLIETASEAPRAAAEVMATLRAEVSQGLQRDNALLEERSRILETLNTLLAGIGHASTEQRAVIDALVASSATALQQASSQFAEQVGAERAQLSETVAQVGSSAIEVASLGESFGFAVQAFHAGNERLMEQLQRIEAALDKSMARSDEQLAYYVAQAREIMDLSILSQKQMLEALHQGADKGTARTSTALSEVAA